jgi:hypothetical protein
MGEIADVEIYALVCGAEQYFYHRYRVSALADRIMPLTLEIGLVQ